MGCVRSHLEPHASLNRWHGGSTFCETPHVTMGAVSQITPSSEILAVFTLCRRACKPRRWAKSLIYLAMPSVRSALVILLYT